MNNYRIQGATGEWEVVIGLEVHAQVTSHSKLLAIAVVNNLKSVTQCNTGGGP